MSTMVQADPSKTQAKVELRPERVLCAPVALASALTNLPSIFSTKSCIHAPAPRSIPLRRAHQWPNLPQTKLVNLSFLYHHIKTFTAFIDTIQANDVPLSSKNLINFVVIEKAEFNFSTGAGDAGTDAAKGTEAPVRFPVLILVSTQISAHPMIARRDATDNARSSTHYDTHLTCLSPFVFLFLHMIRHTLLGRTLILGVLGQMGSTTFPTVWYG